MGTDIHVVAQVFDGEKWNDLDISDFDIEGRSYSWFTFLCGMRDQPNIEPIAKPRGCPKDFQVTEPEGYDIDTYYKGKWMGYGISSWVTMAEIIEKEPPPIDGLYRIGPIDDLLQLFKGHDPDKCRIVFGFDH